MHQSVNVPLNNGVTDRDIGFGNMESAINEVGSPIYGRGLELCFERRSPCTLETRCRGNRPPVSPPTPREERGVAQRQDRRRAPHCRWLRHGDAASPIPLKAFREQATANNFTRQLYQVHPKQIYAWNKRLLDHAGPAGDLAVLSALGPGFDQRPLSHLR
jgi:hypothetical protein